MINNPEERAAQLPVVNTNTIIQLAMAHEPRSIYRDDGNSYHPDASAAISRILPVFDGIMRLPLALMMNSPDKIKHNIQTSDTDTLLLFFKCLGVEASRTSGNSALGVVGSVQNYILSVLLARLSSK